MAISYDGLARRLNLRKDETLKRILSEGARVMAKEGFERATIRKVAAATGMSLSSLYYYFRSKEDLLFQIQFHTFRTLLETLGGQLEGVEAAEERLRVFVRNHLSHFLRHMPELKVCSHELWTLTGENYRKVEELRRDIFKTALDIVKDIQPRRSGMNPRLATLGLFGMLNWIYTWYDPHESEGERRLSNQMTNLFLNGIRGEEHVPSRKQAKSKGMR